MTPGNPSGVAGAGAPGGWRAALHLRVESGPVRPCVRRSGGYGPLYLQKPFFPEDHLAHLYLLHPPGGLVGGDQLDIGIATAPGAATLVTTPSAAKFYRSSGHPVAVCQRLSVAAESSLEWLPQESLFFSGTRASILTEVTVSPAGRFIGWDISSLGRPASGDHFSTGQVTSELRVQRPASGSSDGAMPLLIERNRWRAGDPLLTAPWGLAGYPVSGLLVALPADQDILQRVRAGALSLEPKAEGFGALTLIDELLVARVLAVHNEIARRWLESIWQQVRPLVIGRPPCPPRIWQT